MSRRSSRSRPAYDDGYAYAPAPRGKTKVGAIVIGILVAVSAIAVIFKFLSGGGEDPAEHKKAIDVARRAVLAGLTNDMANFQRTIDEMAPNGITDNMSKADRYRFKEGHFFEQPPTAEDRDWIDKQWDRYLKKMSKTVQYELKLKTAQEVDSLFRTAEVESRPALSQIDVRVTTDHGLEMTLYLRSTGDGDWRVGRWKTEGNYY